MKNWKSVLTIFCFVILFLFCAAGFFKNNDTASSSIVANAAFFEEEYGCVTLAKGESVSLYLTKTKEKATWTSDDKSIASITKNGKLTAKKKGSTIVYASTKSAYYYCYVYVEAPRMSKKSLTLIKGDSTWLEIKGNSQPVKWSSSDKTIVKVSKDGYVVAKKTGTVTVTAKLGEGKKELICTITVEAPKISNKSISLEPGQSKQLSVTGTKQKVKWASSKKTVATVTDNGLVNALKKGTTRIVAKVGSKKYECIVTVEKPVISATRLVMVVGSESVLTVKGAVNSVTWTSSNPEVASVYSDGEIYAKNAGTTTIRATVGTKDLTCTVIVESPSLSPKELFLIVGETYQLKLNGTSKAVSWVSSNDAVASVSSQGLVTAKKTGYSIITARVDNEEYDCEINVENPTISDSALTLKRGEKASLYMDDTDQTVVWSSSDVNIASVDKDGLVISNNIGTATITAKVGTKEYRCIVTVEDPQPSIAKYTVGQSAVYTGNGIIVKPVESIYTDTETGIKLYIENNSSLSLGVCVHNSAVNGIMYDNNIYAGRIDIASGKKGNLYFYIDNSWFEKVGIKQIEDFELLLWAYDNDKSYKSFESDIIKIVTNHFSGQTVSLSGRSIYNKDNVQINYLKTDNNKMNFGLLNKTNEYFDFDVEDVSINDWAMDTRYDFDIFDLTVFPNCMAYFTIEADEDFSKESNINKIEKVEFRLDVREKGDYFQSHYTDTIQCTV